jgi:mannose-6-phosphate isomerase-like protein (cupin superfamily)
MPFETRGLPPKYDDIAPDGSEIRLLSRTARGSMCHCSLPAGRTSRAIRHRSVEEIWYFLEGQGEVWRRQGAMEEVTKANPGLSLTIPAGTHFQFRNPGPGPLCFILITLPPWPGPDEAIPVAGNWTPG